MNFAEIENLWRSPHNRPSAAELEAQKMKLIADLRRRRRGVATFIWMVFSALALMTGRFALFLFSPNPGADRMDFAHEWGVLIVLALPWIAAILIARQYLRHEKEHGNYERSVADSVRALLDENRLARRRMKIAAALHGGFLLVLPVVVYQLRAVGKAGDEILLPAFVGWPVVALCIGTAMVYNYRRKLLPQKRELEGLLESYR